MNYKIVVSPRAQVEIENAIDFYAMYSANAPASFINSLIETYKTIEINPFFRIQYKNILSIRI